MDDIIHFSIWYSICSASIRVFQRYKAENNTFLPSFNFHICISQRNHEHFKRKHRLFGDRALIWMIKYMLIQLKTSPSLSSFDPKCFYYHCQCYGYHLFIHSFKCKRQIHTSFHIILYFHYYHYFITSIGRRIVLPMPLLKHPNTFISIIYISIPTNKQTRTNVWNWAQKQYSCIHIIIQNNKMSLLWSSYLDSPCKYVFSGGRIA